MGKDVINQRRNGKNDKKDGIIRRESNAMKEITLTLLKNKENAQPPWILKLEKKIGKYMGKKKKGRKENGRRKCMHIRLGKKK